MPVDVHDGDELGEGDEGEARGAEAVEQGEPVLARPRGEHQPDREAAHSHAANQYRLLHMLQTENCTFNLLFIRVHVSFRYLLPLFTRMYLWLLFVSFLVSVMASQVSHHVTCVRRGKRTRLSPGLVEEGGHDALQDPDLGAEAEGEQHQEEEG